jgi:para-nitrobenzyl esterase
VLVVTLPSAHAVATAGGAPPCATGTTVQTASGPVCGIVQDGVVSYFSVPYAAAPVGHLRWAPPQQHAPWTTTFEATQPGPVCPQPGIAGEPAPANQSEDCLTLNVQRPTGSASRLPVIVDIHFGGFITGGALDGSELAAQGRVVMVSMNYRLGILGFLAHRGLRPHSGDYGLQDQYAALRWVRQNIAAFGGDPQNVTIEGSSAGGASVCDAMVSPQATGLFRSAISESGFYNYNVNTIWWPADCKSKLQSEVQAQQEGAAFAAKVGCGHSADVMACLRAVPVATLITDAGQVEAPFAGGVIGPIVNGSTLPLSPSRAFRIGRFDHNVNLIIGVARDEFNGGVYNAPVVANTASQYRALVGRQFGSLASAVIARYPLERFPDSSPFISPTGRSWPTRSACVRRWAPSSSWRGAFPSTRTSSTTRTRCTPTMASRSARHTPRRRPTCSQARMSLPPSSSTPTRHHSATSSSPSGRASLTPAVRPSQGHRSGRASRTAGT